MHSSATGIGYVLASHRQVLVSCRLVQRGCGPDAQRNHRVGLTADRGRLPADDLANRSDQCIGGTVIS